MAPRRAVRAATLLASLIMTQLMVISPAEYDAGVKRIRAAAAEVGTEARLRADLRIYGTMGWIS